MAADSCREPGPHPAGLFRCAPPEEPQESQPKPAAPEELCCRSSESVTCVFNATGDTAHLTKTERGGWASAQLRRGPLTGRQYVELTVISTQSSIIFVGVGSDSFPLGDCPSAVPDWWGIDLYSGNLCSLTKQQGWAGQQAYSVGDIIGLLLDLELDALTIFKNDVRLGTIDQSFAIGGDNACWVVSLLHHTDAVLVKLGSEPPLSAAGLLKETQLEPQAIPTKGSELYVRDREPDWQKSPPRPTPPPNAPTGVGSAGDRASEVEAGSTLATDDGGSLNTEPQDQPECGTDQVFPHDSVTTGDTELLLHLESTELAATAGAAAPLGQLPETTREFEPLTVALEWPQEPQPALHDEQKQPSLPQPSLAATEGAPTPSSDNGGSRSAAVALVLPPRAVTIPDLKAVARCARLPELGPRILFFSGGTALRAVSERLKRYTHHSVHLITPFDSGGSSAVIREAFDCLAVGDLRNRLVALSDDSVLGNPQIFRLASYRLGSGNDAAAAAAAAQTGAGIAGRRAADEATQAALRMELAQMVEGTHELVRAVRPTEVRQVVRSHLHWFVRQMKADFDLRGASIGNLMLVGGFLANQRDINTVIYLFSKLLNVRGTVRPTTTDNLHLRATHLNGMRTLGQHLMGKPDTLGRGPIVALEIVRINSQALASPLPSPQQRHLQPHREYEHREQEHGDLHSASLAQSHADARRARMREIRLRDISLAAAAATTSTVCPATTEAAVDTLALGGNSDASATASELSCFASSVDTGRSLAIDQSQTVSQEAQTVLAAPHASAIDPVVRDLILSADVICFPIGSFWTSVMANLLPQGVGQAIVTRQCPKIFIPNTGRDPEMDGLSVADCVELLITQVRRDLEQEVATPVSAILNFVLLDTANMRYEAKVDVAAIEALGVTVVDTDLTYHTKWRQTHPQHHPQPISPRNGFGESEEEGERQHTKAPMLGLPDSLDPDAVCRVLISLGR